MLEECLSKELDPKDKDAFCQKRRRSNPDQNLDSIFVGDVIDMSSFSKDDMSEFQILRTELLSPTEKKQNAENKKNNNDDPKKSGTKSSTKEKKKENNKNEYEPTVHVSR